MRYYLCVISASLNEFVLVMRDICMSCMFYYDWIHIEYELYIYLLYMLI